MGNHWTTKSKILYTFPQAGVTGDTTVLKFWHWEGYIQLTLFLNFIISPNIQDFEKDYFNKFDKFEELYARFYKEKKRDYYINNNIYDNSKFKSEISSWMIDRLLYLDLEYSIEKFIFSNVLNYISKKYDLKNN